MSGNGFGWDSTPAWEHQARYDLANGIVRTPPRSVTPEQVAVDSARAEHERQQLGRKVAELISSCETMAHLASILADHERRVSTEVALSAWRRVLESSATVPSCDVVTVRGVPAEGWRPKRDQRGRVLGMWTEIRREPAWHARVFETYYGTYTVGLTQQSDLFSAPNPASRGLELSGPFHGPWGPAERVVILRHGEPFATEPDSNGSPMAKGVQVTKEVHGSIRFVPALRAIAGAQAVVQYRGDAA